MRIAQILGGVAVVAVLYVVVIGLHRLRGRSSDKGR
jgi:hypothetical protein